MDDFMRDPQLMRREARILHYSQSPLNPSNFISQKSKYAGSIYRRLIGIPRRSVNWDVGSGTYRTTDLKQVQRTRNQFFAHSDGITDFVALLYLSLPAECHGGTAFFRHKKTGLQGFHDDKAVQKAMAHLGICFEELANLVEGDARVPSKWVQTDLIQMKYNRMIVYNGRVFHSHVFDFKSVRKGSERLTFACYGTLTGSVTARLS
jgi:Family of unknown function (DUF6445)